MKARMNAKRIDSRVNPRLSLNGQIALVLGGSRGIGRAIALTLAREGADVVIGYLRNENEAGVTVAKIRKIGKNASLIRANVGRPEEVEEMFATIGKDKKRLDILVYSAALGIFKPLKLLTPAQIKRTLEINAVGFVHCSQQASRLMHDGGTIVGLSSLGSQRYFHSYGALGLAKAAMEAAIRYLAVELASLNIRVNGVSGGPVETNSIRHFPFYKKQRAESKRYTPAGRIAKPEDMAGVVLALCKNELTWVRGQTIIADGGLSLRVLSC